MVKFGLDLTIWPWEYRSFDEIVDIACLAEKYGLDSLWMSDHLMFITLDKGSLEVSTSLAAVAMRTRRLTVGTKVLCAPFRHPSLIAKTGVTLDIISNGRFILGIGAGWYKREFEAFGFPFENRANRIKETVEIIKMLWTKSVVNYEGKYYRINKAESLPKPLQKPHPPIWIGAEGPRMLKLTAELGDGWIIANPTVESFRQRWSLIKEHAKNLGRTSEEIEAAYYVYASIAAKSETASKCAEEHILPWARGLTPNLSMEDLREICIVGDPDEWIRRIEDYVAAGARHVIVKIVPLSRANLRLYADKVVTHFKEQS